MTAFFCRIFITDFKTFLHWLLYDSYNYVNIQVVTGSYTVHLPDGRIQTVTYTADHYNGYVADVKV